MTTQLPLPSLQKAHIFMRNKNEQQVLPGCIHPTVKELKYNLATLL